MWLIRNNQSIPQQYFDLFIFFRLWPSSAAWRLPLSSMETPAWPESCRSRGELRIRGTEIVTTWAPVGAKTIRVMEIKMETISDSTWAMASSGRLMLRRMESPSRRSPPATTRGSDSTATLTRMATTSWWNTPPVLMDSGELLKCDEETLLYYWLFALDLASRGFDINR